MARFHARLDWLRVLGLLGVLTSGCAAHSHVRIGTWIEPMAGVQERLHPDGLQGSPPPKVAVVLAADQAAISGPDSDVPEPRYAADPAWILDLSARLLTLSNVFPAVTPISAPEATPGNPQPWLEAARTAQADLVLILAVRRAGVSFAGYDEFAVANTVIWAVSGYPSHWAHDQWYEATVVLHARVLDVATGETLFDADLPVGTARDCLNYHERGRGWLRYLLVMACPPAFYPVNARSLNEHLAPRALVEPVRSLTGQLATMPRGPYRIQVERRGPPRLIIRPNQPTEGQTFDQSASMDLDISLYVTEPDNKIVEVTLDGVRVWPGDAKAEGETPAVPDRRHYVLQVQGHPVKDKRVAVAMVDAKGRRAELFLEFARPAPIPSTAATPSTPQELGQQNAATGPAAPSSYAPSDAIPSPDDSATTPIPDKEAPEPSAIPEGAATPREPSPPETPGAQSE